jgi:hypothetical protein
MHDGLKPRRAAAQQHDFLGAALRSGKRISLDRLLPLEWRLPPDHDHDRDPRPGDPFYLPTAAQWRAGELRRAAAQWRADELLVFRTPGLLVTAAACEDAKYGAPWPNDDAPLREHVGRYLLHIRGKWSRIVWGARHKAPTFREFLADYVGDRLGIGCYLSNEPAAQLLRLATGQPRFLPAKTDKCK